MQGGNWRFTVCEGGKSWENVWGGWCCGVEEVDGELAWMFECDGLLLGWRGGRGGGAA